MDENHKLLDLLAEEKAELQQGLRGDSPAKDQELPGKGVSVRRKAEAFERAAGIGAEASQSYFGIGSQGAENSSSDRGNRASMRAGL